ncbi:helicase associated domain-containing protein, partial [Streptomyces lavendofoliae]|uniref:helicase associated domain-containing protein n=1 Tax=Streptomyces lavendofoliae TaxID=67314 RepID=UPI00300EDD1E
WPIDWQRHYAGVRALVVDGGAAVDEITPGVTVHGADVGRWLVRQRETWAELSEAQRERLAALGITAPEPTAAPTAGGGRAAAWEHGVAAARAYLAREGTLTGVSRAHVEPIVHEDQDHAVKLGVWLTPSSRAGPGRESRGGPSRSRRPRLLDPPGLPGRPVKQMEALARSYDDQVTSRRALGTPPPGPAPNNSWPRADLGARGCVSVLSTHESLTTTSRPP